MVHSVHAKATDMLEETLSDLLHRNALLEQQLGSQEAVAQAKCARFRLHSNTKGWHSSTDLAMGFANVRAGTKSCAPELLAVRTCAGARALRISGARAAPSPEAKLHIQEI